MMLLTKNILQMLDYPIFAFSAAKDVIKAVLFAGGPAFATTFLKHAAAHLGVSGACTRHGKSLLLLSSGVSC